MPRLPRIVIPGVPHHVTQRGARRLQTFFAAEDYDAYKADLATACRAAGVGVLAYCLMPNHVHLLLVPEAEDALRRVLSEVHREHAIRVNKRNKWTGHLWQERFYSCAVCDDHLIAAVRYIELNPVRARLAIDPEDWPWSSAAAHIARNPDGLVGGVPPLLLDGVATWSEFLGPGLDDRQIELVRLHVRSGRPLGGEASVRALEARSGRPLAARPVGRPRRERLDLSPPPARATNRSPTSFARNG